MNYILENLETQPRQNSFETFAQVNALKNKKSSIYVPNLAHFSPALRFKRNLLLI